MGNFFSGKREDGGEREIGGERERGVGGWTGRKTGIF
jgi:hypothetical protein